MRPVIFYTDIVSGPNKGGENDKGVYLSVFGTNFWTQDSQKSAKVFVGNFEVDNYRYFGQSRGRPGIQQITVQIGLIGDPAPGVPLPVVVAVNGIRSDNGPTFTVNPGRIYFVSLTGKDALAAPDSIANPYRTVQTSSVNNNGTTGCPASKGNQAVAEVGVWGQVRAGDFIIMRGGTWTDISKDGFFLRVQNKSGSAPTGKVGSGPITIMGYPTERVFINRINAFGDNQAGGGISSADGARQALGCGAWVAISNLVIESGFNDGVINTQNGASNPEGSYWRVVNNELTATSCKVNTKCRGGGVAGAGAGGFWVGNHVHDVHDKPDLLTSFENHGFYMEGVGAYEVAYNWIENIVGGNGIQTHSTSSPITNNAKIHHNLISGVGKHGINIGDGSESNIHIYDNVIEGSDVAGIRFNSTQLAGAKIFNNTIVNTDRLGKGGTRAALMNDANIMSGSIELKNNIVVPGNGRLYLGGSVGFAAIAKSISHNLWYAGKGAVVGEDHVFGDPLFQSTKTHNVDFHLRPGSPAIDSGSSLVLPLVRNDFDVVTNRPQGKGYDIGAFEWVR